MAVCSEIHTKHINTVSGQNVVFPVLHPTLTDILNDVNYPSLPMSV